MSVADDGDSRNVTCALNSISTYLLFNIYFYQLLESMLIIFRLRRFGLSYITYKTFTGLYE